MSCIHPCYLRNCGIGDSLAKALADATPPAPTFARVFLNDNRLTAAGVRPLLQKLATFHLTTLDLSSNHIGHHGARAIADALKTAPIVELKLENCRLGDAASAVVAKAARPPLATLNMSRCEVGRTAASALGAMLARVDTIEQLDLSWNSVRGSGAVKFASGLAKNSSITVCLCVPVFAAYCTSRAYLLLSTASGHILERSRVLSEQ